MFLAGHAMPSFELLSRLRPARAPVAGCRVRAARRDRSRPRRATAAARARGHRRARARRQVRHAELSCSRCCSGPRSCAKRAPRPVRCHADPHAAAGGLRRGDCARQVRRIAIPKRFSLPMRELVALQPRFERRAGRRALRLLEHPRFRAAYDFLLSARRGRRDRSGARRMVDATSRRCPPDDADRARSSSSPASRRARQAPPPRRRRRRQPARERRRAREHAALDAGVRRDSAAISTIRRRRLRARSRRSRS